MKQCSISYIKKEKKKSKILGLLPIDERAGESEDPGDGMDGELVRLLGNAVVDLTVDPAVCVLGPHPDTMCRHHRP
jgi:hypothetical protein